MSSLYQIDLVILFFFLGMIASWSKSDLDVPESIGKFLSMFLLLSLGLKGGHEVRVAEDLSDFGILLGLGILSCLLIPLYLFKWLGRRMGEPNAAGLAASYGSVSAVTFITAQGYLNAQDIKASPFMVAIMALMEIPAIIAALALYRAARPDQKLAGQGRGFSIFSAKSVVLLLGGFVIGLVLNDPSWLSLKPLLVDSFKGILAFFLLDLGVAAQRQLRHAWKFRWRAIMIGCVLPLAHGLVTFVIAGLLGVEGGDRVLISVLVGSASYIAAPAAIRTAVPDANPSLYMAIPLALTFPMNVIIGIPIYIQLL